MTDIEQRARNLIASEYGPTEYLGTGNTMPGEGPARVRAIREGRGDGYWEMRVVKKALEAHDATKAEFEAFRRGVSGDMRNATKALLDECDRQGGDCYVSNEALAILASHILPPSVDPLLIKARKLVADIARHLDRHDYADLVEAGDRDKSNEVQRVLRGLTITERQP